MRFFELFALKGEKRRLKYIRYETEEMMGHLQALVEDYQGKIKACTKLTTAWPHRQFSEIAAESHAIKTHVLQGHEHTKHTTAKCDDLVRFTDETMQDERLLQHRQMEMRMKVTLHAIINLCKSLDHLLVQEAIFFKDDTDAVFRQQIGHLVTLVQQEVGLYEQIHRLLDELDVENQNIRERLKHERYVEEEYDHVRNATFPQVRDNL